MVKVIEGYTLNEVIGEGNFGSVYRATHKEKSGVFAVKVIPVQKFQENQKLQIYTNNQIEALQAIGISDYIIRFYEMIKSKNNWYLVYEFCNGGTLLNILKKEQRFQEKRALLIFKQLLEAFKVLNKNSIMHRDLKPENIFFTSIHQNQQENDQNHFDKKKVKLGDFGFCKGLKPDENLAKTMLGSPIYMAPQVLKGEPYTTKADIWSLGVILFEMLYGYCPFQSKSIASLINTIDTQPVQLPTKITVSERTQNLIRRMLMKDYFRRIGWVQLFGIRIDDNGEYMDEPQLSASEDRGSTPNKKVFGSLFGSLSIPPTSLISNNRSYSMIRDEQQKNKSRYTIGSKKSMEEVNQPTGTANIQSPTTPVQPLSSTSRVSSQPKDQKRFYSQNYMNILSTPLSSIKRIENEDGSRSIQKAKTHLTNSYQKADKQKSSTILPIPVPSSPPPLLFREERLTSMDNIEILKQKSSELGVPVASNNQPIPFNKYRQNIGMASNLSSRFQSDRNIKQPQRHSNSIFNPPNSSQILQIDAKRTNLLKVHEGITKTLVRTLFTIQEKFTQYKATKQVSDFSTLKDMLQDCYIMLKMVQQKIKSITQSIKITETSLLDMASIISYENIQVQKFIIEIRNQLLRCSAELPNMPSNHLHLSKVDRIENLNSFKDQIRNKSMVQIIDDCL